MVTSFFYNLFSFKFKYSFPDHFADGRMGEYEFLDVVYGHFRFDQDSGAVNDFGRIIADHVYADDISVFFINQDLDNAIAAFIFRNIPSPIPATSGFV